MSKHTDTASWEALGFHKDDMDATAANMMAAYTSWWAGPPSSPEAVDTWASDACREGMCIVAMGVMGYGGLHPPLNDWQEVGRRVVAAVTYYFFGSWRERFRFLNVEYDRAKARAEMAWISYYREGLTVALSLSDWAAADRLLDWPGPDLRFDEGMDDRTREDNAYQIWLASRLRGEQEGSAAPKRELAQQKQERRSKAALGAAKVLRQVETLLPGTEAISNAVLQREMIERGSRRRPKMLLAAADALLAGDAAELSKTLAAYLRHYRKQEIRPNRVDFGVCLDATALWHLGRRRGLGKVPLPEDLMILIARP